MSHSPAKRASAVVSVPQTYLKGKVLVKTHKTNFSAQRFVCPRGREDRERDRRQGLIEDKGEELGAKGNAYLS